MIEGMSVVMQKWMGPQEAPPPVMAPPQYELEGRYSKDKKDKEVEFKSDNSDENMLVDDISLFDEFDDGFNDAED